MLRSAHLGAAWRLQHHVLVWFCCEVGLDDLNVGRVPVASRTILVSTFLQPMLACIRGGQIHY